MSLFPGALPVAGTADPNSTLAAAGHTALHNNDRDEIRALATKMGIGSATPAAGLVLRGNGSGTSAWGQVVLTTDITGILPVANGGTGTTTLAQLKTDMVFVKNDVGLGNVDNTSDATKNASSATLTNKTIAFDANTISNPYKFSVYRNAAFNWGNNAEAQVVFDTEVFDTNNNFTAGAYTIPVSGFYYFQAQVAGATISGSGIYVALYKNSQQHIGNSGVPVGYTGGFSTSLGVNKLLQCTAGDVMTVYVYGGNNTGSTGLNQTYFSGFKVSHS